MTQLINEAKRMQYLAGIINESQLNEENLEEGFKEWILAGLITLGTIGGGMKVYQINKEVEADKKAQIEYYNNVLSKSLDKMSDEQKFDLGAQINRKTKNFSISSNSEITSEEFANILKSYAEKYVKSHPNQFSVNAQDGSLHWKFETAGAY